MAWRVEKRTRQGWKSVGVIETNYEYATEFWNWLGRKWKRTYRLIQED